jgi:drug/metabolite transporter (DMT)-like permease
VQGSNAPSRGLYAKLVAAHAQEGGLPRLARRQLVGTTRLGATGIFAYDLQAVQRLGASRTVIFTNLVPVFGAAFGVLLLGEPLLPSMLLGGAVAIVGVMMVSR